MTDRVFSALADGNRRSIVESLSRGEAATATSLAADLAISRQATAKHLGILAEAGLVVSQRAGRETRYRARPGPLDAVTAWVASVETAWSDRLDALGDALER
ncbi:MAG: metalloregulator ArsR/SmtB family transcription factor [Actinomycetota bacterium]